MEQRLCAVCGADISHKRVDAKCCGKRCQQRNHYVNNAEERKQKRRRRQGRDPAKILFACAKSRAAEKGIPFNIEVSDIVIPNKCPVLHIELSRGKGRLHAASPTLDRIVPSLGYVKGNVRVISHKANRYKSDMTMEECELILEDLKNLRDANR